MNLINSMESNKYAFYIITVLTGIGCTSAFVALKEFAKRNKLI